MVLTVVKRKGGRTLKTIKKSSWQKVPRRLFCLHQKVLVFAKEDLLCCKNRFSRNLFEERFCFFLLKKVAENSFIFVKIILLKSSNCVLALRKWLFCAAKPTLLRCKRAAFGTQNNRFCNTLITRLLDNSCAWDNSLHFYTSLSVYKISSESK